MKTTHIFLHNFRCSGNSLNLALRNYFMNDHAKIGEVHDKFYHQQDIISQCRDRQPLFILGHNVFGLHQHLDFPCRYFVNFREPIDRLVSGFATWSKVQFQDILRYYHNHEEGSNGMTYRVLGFGKNKDGYYDFQRNEAISHLPKINEDLFSEAKANISQYVESILLAEKYCESVVNLEEKLNLPALVCPQGMVYNQNKTFITAKHFPASTISTLRELNLWDTQLYQYSKNLLENELAAKNPGFVEKVRHRKLLDSIMRVRGSDILNDATVLERLKLGINTLLYLGLRSDLVDIIRLFINSISINMDTAGRIVANMQNILPDADYSQLLSALEDKRDQFN